MDWKLIQERIVALLKKHGANLANTVTGDVVAYYKRLADLVTVAASTGNEGMLRSIGGSMQLVAALEGIRGSDEFYSTVKDVLDIVGEILLAFLASIPKL